ncbi:hypothetical protein F4703DRAFT_1948802 [Phycomyces blakesleeanus]
MIDMTTDTTQISNSLFGPQSHNADPGSHDHTLSGQTLHATLDVILVPSGGHNIYQLARNEGGISCPTNLPLPTALIHTCQNEQHYLNGVPEQAGWLQGLLSDDSDSQDIEAVSAPWVEVDSPAYSRQGECGGRFSISLHIYKELVKAVLSSFSSYPTDMGSSFHGLICSLADPPSPNFCFMETRPKGNSNRRNVDTMVSMG